MISQDYNKLYIVSKCIELYTLIDICSIILTID